MMAYTIALYPKIGLREKVESTCEATPIPGEWRCKPPDAEEPEQMLPQERRSALVPHHLPIHYHQRNVETRAQVAIEQQQDPRRKQHAKRQQS